jgi:hypothetical protein
MSQPEMKVDSDGTKYWLLKGKLHCEDGPAVERSDGTKFWYFNGVYHRVGGPAIELPSGEKQWFLHGKFHREDGPAVEYVDGTKRWFFKDEEVTWKEVFRNANGDLEKECRILTYALTTP